MGPAQHVFSDRLRSGELLLGAMLKTPTVHATENPWRPKLRLCYSRSGACAVRHSCLGHARPGGARVRDCVDRPGCRCKPFALAGRARSRLHRRSCAARVFCPDCSGSRQGLPLRGGHRGFSPSCRAGNYGARSLVEHVEHGDSTVTIIAMIEDPEAVADIDAIVAVGRLDAIVLGRGGLAVVLNEPSLTSPRVVAVVDKVVAACKAKNRRIIFFT